MKMANFKRNLLNLKDVCLAFILLVLIFCAYYLVGL
jgi:hypothetical protein